MIYVSGETLDHHHHHCHCHCRHRDHPIEFWVFGHHCCHHDHTYNYHDYHRYDVECEVGADYTDNVIIILIFKIIPSIFPPVIFPPGGNLSLWWRVGIWHSKFPPYPYKMMYNDVVRLYEWNPTPDKPQPEELPTV